MRYNTQKDLKSYNETTGKNFEFDHFIALVFEDQDHNTPALISSAFYAKQNAINWLSDCKGDLRIVCKCTQDGQLISKPVYFDE